MQTIQIDKKSNKAMADASVDLQPGASVTVKCTVKANDDQTLTLTAEEIEVSSAPEAMEESYNETDSLDVDTEE